jgi:pilus assembly protein Flp/PilA
MDGSGDCQGFSSVVESVIPKSGVIPHHQENKMKKLMYKLSIWKDAKGQDLIEYALMAGFVAVAAGAIMPDVASSISQIFSKVTSVLSNSNAG